MNKKSKLFFVIIALLGFGNINFNASDINITKSDVSSENAIVETENTNVKSGYTGTTSITVELKDKPTTDDEILKLFDITNGSVNEILKDGQNINIKNLDVGAYQVEISIFELVETVTLDLIITEDKVADNRKYQSENTVPKVSDTTPTISGVSNTTINMYSTFDAKNGITAKSGVTGNDLTDKIVIVGSVDSSYGNRDFTLTYNVTDPANSKITTKTRKIHVNNYVNKKSSNGSLYREYYNGKTLTNRV